MGQHCFHNNTKQQNMELFNKTVEVIVPYSKNVILDLSYCLSVRLSANVSLACKHLVYRQKVVFIFGMRIPWIKDCRMKQ